MKPTTLRPGDEVRLISSLGGNLTAYFVKRLPGKNGRRAVNILKVPVYAGLSGQGDEGLVTMNDKDFQEKVTRSQTTTLQEGK